MIIYMVSNHMQTQFIVQAPNYINEHTKDTSSQLLPQRSLAMMRYHQLPNFNLSSDLDVNVNT